MMECRNDQRDTTIDIDEFNERIIQLGDLKRWFVFKINYFLYKFNLQE
jgi:hypothetical protein